jgi:hypothetical protein
LAQLSELQSLALHAEGSAWPLFPNLLEATPRLSGLSVSTGFLAELNYVFENLTIDPLREETYKLSCG